MRVLVAAIVFFVGAVHAAPIAVSTTPGVTIILTDEPCAFKEVRNLPRRATWTEHGTTFEGCWGAGRVLGNDVVLGYFSDQSVVVIPVLYFRAAVEA